MLFSCPCRLEALRKIRYSDARKQAQHAAFPLDEWAAEMRLTEAVCARLGSPVVWSHMDLLSGNVLVARKVCECRPGRGRLHAPRGRLTACRMPGPKAAAVAGREGFTPACSQEPGLRGEAGSVPSTQFIDFEYSAYAPRGFDWGNHFNEYAGFECEYGRYPDRAHAANFVRSYMAEGSQQAPVRCACRFGRHPLPCFAPSAQPLVGGLGRFCSIIFMHAHAVHAWDEYIAPQCH